MLANTEHNTLEAVTQGCPSAIKDANPFNDKLRTTKTMSAPPHRINNKNIFKTTFTYEQNTFELTLRSIGTAMQPRAWQRTGRASNIQYNQRPNNRRIRKCPPSSGGPSILLNAPCLLSYPARVINHPSFRFRIISNVS